MKTMKRICAAVLMAVLAMVLLAPAAARAEDEDVTTVCVGYYENEVFEEGAREGAVKTGYAYEYYRKLSEYTGWSYEYVYGSYGDLYQMLTLTFWRVSRFARSASGSFPTPRLGWATRSIAW